MLLIRKAVKNTLIFVITLFALTSSFGCSSKSPVHKDTITYETKVHKIQFHPVDCGELKLKKIGVQLEDPSEHPGSKKNQEINTRNLIILDHKLKEAESLMQCYKRQTKDLIDVVDNYNNSLSNKK